MSAGSIFGVFLFLIIVGGGIGAYFYFDGQAKAKAEEEAAAAQAILDAIPKCLADQKLNEGKTFCNCIDDQKKMGTDGKCTPRCLANQVYRNSVCMYQLPTDITGLVAQYTGDSFDATTNIWKDLSTNNNNATTSGPITNNLKLNGNVYLTGGINDSVKFPVGVLPPVYTLFHVTKYNGANKGRIVNGMTGNFLDGHWYGRSGVSHHDGWVTQESTDLHQSNWVLSTSNKSRYRSNGVDRTAGAGGASAPRIQINSGDGAGGGERSDWAMAELIVYNRELSFPEMNKIETYLAKKYALVGIVGVEAFGNVTTDRRHAPC
jgi:hypothetical protein